MLAGNSVALPSADAVLCLSLLVSRHCCYPTRSFQSRKYLPIPFSFAAPGVRAVAVAFAHRVGMVCRMVASGQRL